MTNSSGWYRWLDARIDPLLPLCLYKLYSYTKDSFLYLVSTTLQYVTPPFLQNDYRKQLLLTGSEWEKQFDRRKNRPEKEKNEISSVSLSALSRWTYLYLGVCLFACVSVREKEKALFAAPAEMSCVWAGL